MKTNAQGVKLIKKYESCVLTAYRDGGGVLTIGWGHTSAAGAPRVLKGLEITQAKADQIFLIDLKKYEVAVGQTVKVPVSDNQFAALVSLCYNIGPGAFKKSTLVKRLNQGDYQGAGSQFLQWNKDNGKTIRGLTNRRKAELKLYNSGSFPNPKPVYKQKTAIAGAGAAAGGSTLVVGSTIEAVKEFTDTAQDASWSLSGGDIFGLVIGALIVGFGLYVLYNRWKDSK